MEDPARRQSTPGQAHSSRRALHLGTCSHPRHQAIPALGIRWGQKAEQLAARRLARRAHLETSGSARALLVLSGGYVLPPRAGALPPRTLICHHPASV